ncbi:unnamed protein product [Adineta ricciae]|uniref:RNA helicase n=1 Tax=Adineta ricciae TaxID=249248 RepID=A0A814ZFL2_ADIRI|nr:unnamed protein product [Adineta ricciae]CAF1242950.1 unnamed protein product [Adineta ricciae]
MILSNLRERSLCLLNSDNLDSSFQPWSTISDSQFHCDVRALYCNANVNPIQSIQTDYLPAFISYFWPLVHRGSHVWAVDHPPTRESSSVKFVLKYDLLVWDFFYRTTSNYPALNSDIVYPKVLILTPDWSTCENTYKHLSNVQADVLKNVLTCCVYEGQNHENDLYKKLLTNGCDLLIATPTVVNDLIQKRHIHFEQLQLIVYDQFDLLLLENIGSIREIFNLLDLHSSKSKSTQHVFLSRTVTQQAKDLILEKFSSNPNYYYLSSSMLETYSYKNFLHYCEPCRNWFERKNIIQETLDLACRHRKKILMCAYQTRRLATMQSILSDLSIQSILIHSQLHHDEIQQYIHEWQTITDRPLILLIQDEILNDIPISNADILIHLDVQRLIWYQLFHQRMKFVSSHFYNSTNVNHLQKTSLTSLKSIDNFYQLNPSLNIPLIVTLWPGDCAQVTYDLIDYIKNSNSYLHPLIERLAKNNCRETSQAKVNVEFCPTLKAFGECASEKKLKRCPYRHNFHYDVDFIEQKTDDKELSDTYELYLPTTGEMELKVTHVSDGNRLWAHILRSRSDVNQNLNKVFDYDSFYQQIQDAFDHVKNRPLREIIPGEVYLYADEQKHVHRVYVQDQEQIYFNIRRADAILNRLLKVSNTTVSTSTEVDDVQETNERNSSMTTINHPVLTVFSLDTGITFSLQSNEYLYPIEPSTLKQYPPLATEIILCNVYPLDKITMAFTPFTIETLRTLTLNEIFMGRIKLATRSCFWIDPLVKPVRLASLKRIAYDKPIRKQLLLSKLIQTNENHMIVLERLAAEVKLIDLPQETKEQTEPTINSEKQKVITEQSPSVQADEDTIEDFSSVFKPFLNRLGQLIINPVGRSKQFFSKHNQQSDSDLVGLNPAANQESSTNNKTTTSITDQYMSLGRGYRINPEPSLSGSILQRPQSTSSKGSSQSLVTTPSEIEPIKMAEMQTKTERIQNNLNDNDCEISQDTAETVQNEESKAGLVDDSDQMMFIFGPKLFSQLRQIKDMEDEQRRQADFPVQRNRNRYMRNHYPRSSNQENNNKNQDDENNETNEQSIPPPNMSRYEPFIGERGPLTQEQINYKQVQRKTRLFWEQTTRDIYLTIGFYNVDSTQTRVEFEANSVYCRTRIRTYDRFVRIHLAHDIIPEKSLFQVRRSNILLTIRKANEGFMWVTLNNRPIEPRPDFFTIEYGSDDESETDKRRRTVNRQWEQIRDDKRKSKLASNTIDGDDNKFLLDDMDEDDAAQTALNDDDEEKNQQELTDTSSDCHSTDSDDCYYEDQVPTNHIPKGYDDADFDHRFYGQQIRS